MEDFFEKFESINDFLATIDNRKMHRVYSKRRSSMDTGYSSLDFTTTKSYSEASELLTNGDAKNAKNITNAIRKVHLSTTAKTKNTIYSAPVGFIPNVGAVMTGHPNNMINLRQQAYKNTKVLSLYVMIGAPGGVNANDIVAFGANVLEAVNALEKSGYRLNIYACHIGYYDKSKNIGGLAVKIKDSGKPLNLTKVAYPLVNPSMLRRHSFRWRETNGQTLDSGYGYSLPKKQALPFLQKHTKGKFAYIAFVDNANMDSKQLLEEINKQVSK